MWRWINIARLELLSETGGGAVLAAALQGIARSSAFSLIFFGLLWYKTTNICLNLSRIAIFAVLLSLIFCLPSLTNGIKTLKSFNIIQIESEIFCSNGIKYPENGKIIQLQDHRRSPRTREGAKNGIREREDHWIYPESGSNAKIEKPGEGALWIIKPIVA